MSIKLNTIFEEAGLDPSKIKIIRHKDARAKKGRTPYDLWVNEPALFELYQSTQSFSNRSALNVPFWAVFIADYENKTMFAGMYSVKYTGLLKSDTIMPHSNGIDKAGECDYFNLTRLDILSEFIGRLYIDWGKAYISWIQNAKTQNKSVIELRQSFKEPAFPGFINFHESLSKIEKLPVSWKNILSNSDGIYLLTFPKTHKRYVGSASGENGFYGRWMNYAQDGHGGDKELKKRGYHDYEITILEVVGSAITTHDLLIRENIWKKKLKTHIEFGGLNWN